MSNIFREGSLVFKPRSNIFSKLRVKEQSESQYESIDENNGSSFMRITSIKPGQKGADAISANTTIIGDDNYKPLNQFQLVSSTPKNRKEFERTKNGSTGDELEITGVRDVPMAKEMDMNDRENFEDTFITKLKGKDVNTSSNDVLLEAFTNTQKICTNLKQALQKQEAENAELRTQISVFKNDSKKVFQTFNENKRILNDLVGRSRLMTDQRIANDEKVNAIKENITALGEKVKEYRRLISDFKVEISNVQSYKNEAEAKAVAKDREIEYLKRELNDCSGKLSEERMKNTSLLKELGKSREEITGSLVTELKNNSEDLECKFSSITAAINEMLHEEIRQQLGKYSESFLKRIFGDIQELREACTSAMETTLESKAKKIAGHLATEQKRVLRQVLSEIGDNLKESVTSINDVSSNSIGVLVEKFSTFKDEMITSNEYKNRIDELQMEISVIKLQKNQALNTLETKQAQYEDANRNLNTKRCEISRSLEIEAILRQKCDSITQELESNKKKLLGVIEENITMKANSENKIAAQGELLKALQSENNTLKQRAIQSDSAKEHNEKESLNRIGKIQSLNEKLQKLNVEMIQVKAHELELEKQNRNLKTSIDDDNSGYAKINDELNLLQQELIVLKGEKQDIMTEKLDQQDKIDELKGIIKNLRQKIKIAEAKKPISAENQKQAIAHCSKPLISSLKSKQVVKTDLALCQLTQMPANNDEFDLPSSLNDDLELTNPSPIEVKAINLKKSNQSTMKPPILSKKKMILLDDDEQNNLKHRWKKRKR